jgi:hypothetical protein
MMLMIMMFMLIDHLSHLHYTLTGIISWHSNSSHMSHTPSNVINDASQHRWRIEVRQVCWMTERWLVVECQI